MVFKCQEDSFLKEYTSKVVSMKEAYFPWKPCSRPETKVSGFEVICENSVLFPEGGGQPCDFGTLNAVIEPSVKDFLNGKNIPVLCGDKPREIIQGQPLISLPVRSVLRKGSEAVIYIETKAKEPPFAVGQEVKQCVDWDRRLDHMQQHSGQHLITALFDREFKYDTTSWWLGSDMSKIELNTTHVISRESLDMVERMANELIREGREVTVFEIDPESAVEFQDARAPRGLPKDHIGLVRVVRIEGIESNMCCGTHVTNLSQLQCIKLLYVEKAKGNAYVHFVVGERAIRKLNDCFQRELMLNLELKGGPAQHLDLVQKLKIKAKLAEKGFQKLLKEIAIIEANKVETTPLPKYYILHRKEGIELGFIETFLRHAPKNVLYFLTISEKVPTGGKGHFVLSGDPVIVPKFATRFCELLATTGFAGKGKEGFFQANYNNGEKIGMCEEMIEDYFSVLPRKSAISVF